MENVANPEGIVSISANPIELVEGFLGFWSEDQEHRRRCIAENEGGLGSVLHQF